jgi:hypothetical protein
MTRDEIIETFRAEYPEITDRVIGDALLAAWCKTGDKVICAQSRCIISDVTFDSVVTTSVYDTKYDLTLKIPKFYDIDSYPGGGVIYDEEPLDKTTIAKLDAEHSGWRSNSAGTPEAYYRRGAWLYFDCPVSTVKVIRVYCVLISDDFDSADLMPYNQLAYLEPFHYALVKYLGWKAKLKAGKPGEAQEAATELAQFISWMKKELSGGKYTDILFRGPSSPSNAYGV